jgi:hypothetical protein
MEDMMSAIAWDPAEAGPAHALPARPRLTLVQGGATAAPSGGGLRLTRRGRLALLLMAALAVAASVVLFGIGGAGAATPEHTVTVHAGETLSEIAAAELPGMSISDGVVAIQLANDLNTAQVSAGQELVIPRS